MSLSDTARRASDVAAARAAAGAAAKNRGVPMTDRVTDLLGDRRAHAERAEAVRGEQSPGRR
jgi:hypothetical protein